MATAPSARPLPHVNLGFIGHTGHGKTTLVRALLRRLAARPDGFGGDVPVAYGPPAPGGEMMLVVNPPGIPRPYDPLTSEVRCLRAETPERSWSLLDLPGRRRFLRVASSAMGCLDAAVLVVSAVEADRPQTREHLLHARGLGAKRLVVFLSHCDAVEDPAWIDEVEREARQVLVECGRAGDEVPFVRGAALPALLGDARWTPTIDLLVDALDHEIELPTRDPDAPPVALVDRVHSIRGRATVAVGVVLRGTIRAGQELELLGGNPLRGVARRAVGRSLERHGERAASVSAGDCFGVLLHGLTRDDVRRGQVLVAPDQARPTTRFTCALELLAKRRGDRGRALRSGMRGQFCLGTAKVPGTLAVGEPAMLSGERREVTVTLDWPTWVEPGLALTFRDGTQWEPPRDGLPVWGGTAGHGVVTAILPDAP